MFTAFSYMELSEMLPFAGGGYFFVKQAFKGLTPFLAGWFSWFGNMAYGALAALTAGLTLNLFIPFIPPVWFAVALTLIFIAINMIGAKETGRLEVILTIILLLGLLTYIILGYSNMQLSFGDIFESDLFNVMITMSLIYPMFIGFEIIAVISEEIKEPHRNIHRSIMYTLVATTAIYILLAVASLLVLPASVLGQTYTPMATVMQQLVGSNGPLYISLLALIATLTTLNSSIMAASRVSFALARDHYLPSSLAHVSFIFRTPSKAIQLSGAIMLLLLLTGFVEFLGLAASFGFLFLLVFVNLALIKLRTRKDIPRFFKAPWFPWTPLIGAGSSLLILLTIDLPNLVFGMFLLIVAIILYEFETGVYPRLIRKQAPWEKGVKEKHILAKPRKLKRKTEEKVKDIKA
ncbi:MAG: amino acid permease [Candidatus Diapherotrites archaeon]|nr:amino acid permease [Candidatus Diapherotrites archaeon]